ncbi:MAG TPA: NAD-glutamate dehydrogenase domain-containing protein, partial [Myxococcaceae bacterium]
LGVEAEALSPAELIRGVLRAPVDLLYNGGVGTYVKAATETQADAVDKANDPVRVDARELRCRVVGEGGNLGFTQRGRIEYAQSGGPEHLGGRINTDAIDNVAGVNTSDHEVNIKILLDGLLRRQEIQEPERNQLLVEMTDAVAANVLYDSYVQGQAISLSLIQAKPMIDVHGRLIRWLELQAGLDRELEALPSEDEISERKSTDRGLTSPEIAVVIAYCKIHLYAELLESDLPEDDYLGHDLEHYFPHALERFRPRMGSHRLRREIIASVVANELVDRAGTTFAFRLGEETGAPTPLLARGYTVAREVFRLLSFWHQVEALDGQIGAAVQLDMLIEGRRLAERAARALVRGNPTRIDIESSVRRFEPGVRLLDDQLEDLLEGADLDAFRGRAGELQDSGVPAELARRVAAMPSQPAAFDVVTVAADGRHELAAATRAYFRIGARLELNWLRDRIVELPRANRWQALARTALREELLGAQRELTREILEATVGAADTDQAIDRWSATHAAGVERLQQTLAEIRASGIYDTTTLAVGLREVRALIRGQTGFTRA